MWVYEYGCSEDQLSKQTRFADNGFRQALCPCCGEWIYIISYENDTLWRYGRHKIDIDKVNCDGSYELVPKKRIKMD